MNKWYSIYRIMTVGTILMFLVMLHRYYNNSLKLQQHQASSEEEDNQIDVVIMPQTVVVHETKANLKIMNSDAFTPEMKEVFERQRRTIEDEMRDYNYPNGKNLEDFLMDAGGNPMRSIVLTSWRSGSTFFGQILNAHPANFYHYEPLLDFGITQIRGPPNSEQALWNLKALLNCEYEDLGHYLDYGHMFMWFFSSNTRLRAHCPIKRDICWDPRFLSGFCRLFPFQSMKLVRMRLHLAEELLKDTNLGVRITFLTRDPRGVLQSRKHHSWCTVNPDCSDPDLVCGDMVSDFEAAIKFLEKYPDRFRVLRYEDLALEPRKYAEELYKFYGLDFHPNVQKYLDSHTRRSEEKPFHWKKDLNFEYVDEIQRSCVKAMQYWGYLPAMNATHQKTFNPVTDYQMHL